MGAKFPMAVVVSPVEVTLSLTGARCVAGCGITRWAPPREGVPLDYFPRPDTVDEKSTTAGDGYEA